MKLDRDAVASTVALIQAMDVHEAAKGMAEGLKLNAEVRTCVGKWDERGSIAGWTKTANTARKGPATVLVEVFVSDITGEDREFDRYARKMQELADENANLKALNAGYKTALDAIEGVHA